MLPDSCLASSCEFFCTLLPLVQSGNLSLVEHHLQEESGIFRQRTGCFQAFPASSKPTTEFAQPGLRRSNGGHSQREGINLGVFVPVWLVSPRCEPTDLGVFDLCYFNLLKLGCANSGGFGARLHFQTKSGAFSQSHALSLEGPDKGRCTSAFSMHSDKAGLKRFLQLSVYKCLEAFFSTTACL